MVAALETRLALAPETLRAICEQFHVRAAWVFGSVLREDYHAESDIDMLVEYEDGVAVTLFEMGALQMTLSRVLGRQVDLKTRGFLTPSIADEVRQTAQVILATVGASA